MRGAATASGAAAAASCTKHPHAKIRAAPTGRRRTKQCASGAGRGSPRGFMVLRDAALLLGGAVAGVGLAQGSCLLLELFAGGCHGTESCVESWACVGAMLMAARNPPRGRG